MYFVYSVLLLFGLLILLPRFVIDAFRHGKYVVGLRERLGSVSPLENPAHPVIWLHCVSVGETQAARPLVRNIKAKFPDSAIVISTTTSTGQGLARKIFGDDVAKVFYFPFDWHWVVGRTLNAIKPATVLLMETEIWPAFLRECYRRQIPVAIVNGRLSDQSFRRYRVVKGFMMRVLGSLSLAIMQTEADADRLIALGMSGKQTFVAGNLKFDAGAEPINEAFTSDFRQRFGLQPQVPFVLAASTHQPEERIILDAFKQISAAKPDSRLLIARLLIAPRHPERFAEVGEMIRSGGFRWSRRSAPTDQADSNSEVILLDSIGELSSLYSLATIVFVGGSIAKSGGHNILEPAAVGASVIVGPHTYNFRAIVKTFVEAGAIIQLPAGDEPELTKYLTTSVSELLADPPRRHDLGNRARNLVSQNLGASQRTLELLEPILMKNLIPSSSQDRVSFESVPTA